MAIQNNISTLFLVPQICKVLLKDYRIYKIPVFSIFRGQEIKDFISITLTFNFEGFIFQNVLYWTIGKNLIFKEGG